MKRIAIIGAGPAGSYAGYLLAKEGHQVDIYEEHPTIGIPFQCTGILTSQLERFVDIKPSWHVNKVHVARIACNDKYIDVNLNKHNTIIERTKFDQHVAELAKKAGAKIHKKHRFIKNEGMTLTIKDIDNSKEFTRDCDILIGADGPNSTVAKCNGLYGDRKFWVGIQARAEYKNKNIVEVLPQVGTFGWVVPEDENIVRIGLVGDTNVKKDFDKLCKDYGVTKVISYQGGLIPKYDHKAKTRKDNIYLVGDAALQVKATTAGGIIQGMIAGQALAESIKTGKSYEKLWKKRLGKDLWLHAFMRKIMDKLSDSDVEYCIRLFHQPRLKKILEKFDREYPSQFFFKMLLLEPRLLYFAKFLF